MIGTASSLVAIKIAINVPKVIDFFENKSAAITENPHCGTLPSSAPAAVLSFPDFIRILLRAVLFLCSKYSITRYIKKTKGSISMLSKKACSM